MNNNPNNTPEKNPTIGEAPVYSTLSGTPERKPKKRKKSLLKSQLRMLVILGAAIVLLGVGVGLAAFFIGDGDGIIDTFTESKTDTASGKVTYTYHSRADGNSFIITDVEGNTLKNYFVDQNGNPTTVEDSSSTLVFETAIGSLLRIGNNGKITYYALVDYGGDYVGGDTDCRVLLFPNTDQEQITQISVHNKNGENGSAIEFDVMGLDTDGDGETDHFQIKGYEKATLNQLVAASLCSYGGYTLTMKKLSIDFMEAYDQEHAEDEGYTPLLDADKNIRFEEYGLDEESAAYYEITTRGGKKYRVYIGSECPNGGGFYVRYYDEEEGNRNAVYRIADDPGISAALGVEMSRSFLFLGKPENLIYAQLNYPASMTTYLMAESFKTYFRDPTSDRADEEGYRKVIDFSYTDLEIRNYTIDQTKPYILNDKSMLAGYMLNSDRVNEALQDLYDISSILASDYGTSAVKNYVKVQKLVRDVTSGAQSRPNPAHFSTAEKYIEAFDKYAKSVEDAVNKAVNEDGALYQLLEAYGLAEPEYKFSYYTTAYAAANFRLPLEFNCIWVSELTEKNTYYVWAPMYQQVIEIGYQYLSFLNWDSFDWVTDDVYDISINYLDSIRVTGKDSNGKLQDILYEIASSYDITWNTGFVSAYKAPYNEFVTSSAFNITAGLKYDGSKVLTIKSNVKYTVEMVNSSTGETTDDSMTLSAPLVSSISLDTVKTYCEWVCSRDPDAFYAGLSSEMQESLTTYSKSNPAVSRSEASVTIKHTISDANAIATGNHLLPAQRYIVTITYDRNDGYLTVTAGQEGQAAPLVYDEKVFENYCLLKIKNNGDGDAEKIAAMTEEDLRRVSDLYSAVNGLTTVQNQLRVSIFDENGQLLSSKEYLFDKNDENAEGSIYIKAFKKFYGTMLYSTYAGYADEAETVGGKKLTPEEMEAYQAAGDNCDLKIDVRLTLDDTKYIYRMYNYSASKSYITVEANETDGGEGMFYLLRTRVEKFISDAVRASQGDTTIEGDTIY